MLSHRSESWCKWTSPLVLYYSDSRRRFLDDHCLKRQYSTSLVDILSKSAFRLARSALNSWIATRSHAPRKMNRLFYPPIPMYKCSTMQHLDLVNQLVGRHSLTCSQQRINQVLSHDPGPSSPTNKLKHTLHVRQHTGSLTSGCDAQRRDVSVGEMSCLRELA